MSYDNENGPFVTMPSWRGGSIQYDLTPAAHESAIRHKLIEGGIDRVVDLLGSEVVDILEGRE